MPKYIGSYVSQDSHTRGRTTLGSLFVGKKSAKLFHIAVRQVGGNLALELQREEIQNLIRDLTDMLED